MITYFLGTTRKGWYSRRKRITGESFVICKHFGEDTLQPSRHILMPCGFHREMQEQVVLQDFQVLEDLQDFLEARGFLALKDLRLLYTFLYFL